MNSNTKNEWQYQGAFVTQLHPETDITEGRYKGRVEHVASYEATHFNSLDELLAFVARLLKEAEVNRYEEEP
ncbi:MAG TPA: hypothetical protein VJS64_05080 [Pyrinomonadaceae bacterium]|nr:hypothetical protein [Pyrinomonadaceae bacterium]